MSILKNNENNTKLLSNKGVTIFEMLLVMVIIAILTGLVSFSIQYVHNANVQKAGETLVAAIRTARTTSMTKGTERGKLTLYSEGGKLYYTIGDSSEKIQISTQAINFDIAFGVDMHATNLAPSVQEGDGTCVIKFDTTGMLKVGEHDANYIVFFKGRRCYSVLIYPDTGKVVETLFYY